MAMKLFHHLAVGQDVKGGYHKIRNETVGHFKKKDIFEGLDKEYRPLEEGGQPLERQQKEVITTVQERLAWTKKKAVAFIDFELVRDKANTVAVADLVVDGKVLAKGLPATFLLALEKRLDDMREYYDVVPTLDLSKKWEESGQIGVFRHGPVKTFRTAKKTISITIAKATKEHPEQAKAMTEDVTIGCFDSVYFSGMVHARDKAEWLGQIDKLLEVVKKARQQANDVVVDEGKIGETIFDFIHGKGD